MLDLDLIVVLARLGLTSDAIIPLLLLGVVGYVLVTRRLDQLLEPIHHAIVELQAVLAGSGHGVRYLLTEQRRSPLVPSAFGLQVVKASGLARLLEDRGAALLRQIDGELQRRGGRSAYDVQEAAEHVLRRSRNRRCMDPVKNYAFTEGLSLDTLFRTAALILRDDFLKRGPHGKAS